MAQGPRVVSRPLGFVEHVHADIEVTWGSTVKTTTDSRAYLACY